MSNFGFLQKETRLYNVVEAGFYTIHTNYSAQDKTICLP